MCLITTWDAKNLTLLLFRVSKEDTLMGHIMCWPLAWCKSTSGDRNPHPRRCSGQVETSGKHCCSSRSTKHIHICISWPACLWKDEECTCCCASNNATHQKRDLVSARDVLVLCGQASNVYIDTRREFAYPFSVLIASQSCARYAFLLNPRVFCA